MPEPAPLPSTPPALEVAARRFAAMTRDEAERVIDDAIALAVREWRVSDATFWQRVKFRSRMIRTTQIHTARIHTGRVHTGRSPMIGA